MTPIDQRRFNALAGYIRHPAHALFMEELAWYEEGGEALLGVVVLDRSDHDYAAIILARDSKKRFRAISLKHSLSTQVEATIWLRDHLATLVKEPPEAHHQGDEKGQPIDFFEPIVASERRSYAFEQLRTQKGYGSAVGLLRELMHYFEDPDGNFVQQFQSTGFDARLWELYLYAAFTEMGYGFDRTQAVPDFQCWGPLGRLCVEATTIGVSPNTPQLTDENAEAYFDEYIPIRFSSALCQKLQKRYWELPHVEGRPLIIAIQDFHSLGSMSWTADSLPEYLYGLRQSVRNGQLVSETIGRHRWESKDIPSHFFGLPDAEHISAVIANPSGTISKFKRMGMLIGFGAEDLRIVRTGLAYQNQPFTTPFKVEVTASGYNETWCEGMAVYHNPNAAIPLPESALPGTGHFTVEDGWIVSKLPSFFPVGSMTLTLTPREEGPAEG